MREVHNESCSINRCSIVDDNHYITGRKPSHAYRKICDRKTKRKGFNTSKKYATNL